MPLLAQMSIGFVFYYFSEKSLICASMEEAQERNNEQDSPMLQVYPVPPVAPLNSDYDGFSTRWAFFVTICGTVYQVI